MNKAVYRTYLSDLAANEKVEFPNRKEMIEFFSMMMGEFYRIYLNGSAAIPSAEKAIRLSGEPELITFLAKVFQWYLPFRKLCLHCLFRRFYNVSSKFCEQLTFTVSPVSGWENTTLAQRKKMRCDGCAP